MQFICPLPGEQIIILLKCLKEVIKDNKNESKLRKFRKAVYLYLAGVTVLR